MTSKGLNRRQRKFVNAMLETGNQTESARRAGYTGSDETLAVTGSQLIRNPKVAAALEAKEALLESSAVASQAELREFWTSSMRGVEQADMSMRDRLKASEMLGKAKAMFVDRKEVGGVNGGAIEQRVVVQVEDAKKVARMKVRT